MTDDPPKGTNKDRRVEILVQRFAEEYPRYQYAFVEFLTAHLTDIAKAFDGDLQQALILAVIGQVRLRARRQAEVTGDALPPPDELSITASRLADVTGIPRETVRRKLKLLEARGLDREETGRRSLSCRRHLGARRARPKPLRRPG